jgi:hypothetical protein
LWKPLSIILSKTGCIAKKALENLIILRLDDIIILNDDAEFRRNKKFGGYGYLNKKSRSFD